MDYIIEGKHKLNGELPVYGSKNCALALLGATLLTNDCITLLNCPKIVDVENMMELLAELGKKVCRNGQTVTVSGDVITTNIPQSKAKLLRGSGLILGSAISRYHNVFLPETGGCAIGKRPIDIHLLGLKAMGVQVAQDMTGVTCQGVPQGCTYNLRFASVGATENLLCAAVLAKGQTVLTNCALEPEIVSLQNLLVAMGAKIKGIGSSVVTVNGVESLHGAEISVIPDRIVAATYLACAVASGGKLAVTHCCPQHIAAFWKVLSQRFETKIYCDTVFIRAINQPKDYGQIVTAPYPQFPTDLQQIILSLCAMSGGGRSTVTEKLFENRLTHNAEQLNLMGANVKVRDDTATVIGRHLHGATVTAKDLRGGAGLVVAALGADGQTRVRDVNHIQRGYSNLDACLRSVGAYVTL